VWDLIEHIPVVHGLAVGKNDGEPRISNIPFWIVEGLDSNRPQPLNMQTVLEEWAPDIIHVHNMMNPNLWEHLEGFPTVVTLHDHRAFCPGQGKWTLQGEPCFQVMSQSQCQTCFTDPDYFESIYHLTQERQSGLKPFHITAVSSYMAEELSAVGLNTRTVIAPNVAKQTSRPTQTDTKPIIFVGRLVRSKGVWNAVEAWRKAETDIPLVFVGTGRERGALERAGFHVTGWISREETLRMISNAAAVLFPPNWQEPYGMVGPEALQFNVPVVAWKSGGIEEWCPEDFLVDYGDIDGLSQALVAALKAPENLDSSQKNTEKAFTEQWLQAYHEIMNRVA